MEIRRVKRFSKRVFDAVLKLVPQLAPDAELPTEQYFKSLLKSRNVHFFVAELNNKQIVGMLTIGTYDIPTGTKAWIEDVVVDESQRGKGFGAVLTLYAINYSKTLGTRSVNLTSRPSRAAANKLYQKIGFKQYMTNVYKYQLE